MRYLVLGSLGRRISWMLITAMLLPLLVLATPPKQAHAQLTTATQRVAVLDFGVLASNVRSSAILGRNATDALVVEMTRTGQFDVETRTTVNQQLQELGLNQPLNNNGIQKLGQALAVASVVSGDITNVSFTDNPRRARVTVSVRLTDVISGELVNGAIATGYSQAPPPGMTPDDETLVAQALSDAAFNAVKTVNEYNLPAATVLLVRDTTEVTLNRGARDGMQPGMLMTVVRGNVRVAKLRVSTVNATDSIAAVVDFGKGIQPQDKARAIFSLPGYGVDGGGNITTSIPDTKAYRPTGRKTKPILTTVLMIAAAVFLATLLFDSKSRTLNQTGIGKITARAYADVSVSQSSNPAASRVLVTWEPASDIPINNIVEYQVWRDSAIVGVTTRNQKRFEDTSLPTNFPFVTYTTISTNGGINNPGPGNPGGTTTGTTGGTTGGTTTGTTGTTGGTTGTTGGTTGTTTGNTNNGGGGPGSQIPPTLVSVTVPVVPMAVGATHVYRVRLLYARVVTNVPQNNGTGGGVGGGIGGGGIGGGGIGGGGIGGGGIGGGGIGGGGIGGGGIGGGGTTGGTTGNTNNGTTTQYQEGELRASSGQVTPIARPGVNGPTTDQNLSRVQIDFQTVQGADQYTFEFATQPNFQNKVTRGPFFVQSTPNVTSQSEVFDISREFNSLAGGGRVYVRVGARNSLDVPGPISTSTPNGSDFVYSADNRSFAKIAAPPPPPQ